MDLLCIFKTHMEGCDEKGESQEIQVGVHKNAFNLISILFCESYIKKEHILARYYGYHVDIYESKSQKVQSTELLQRVHSILHVDPKTKSAQRDGVIEDGERELCGSAVDLLHF